MPTTYPGISIGSMRSVKQTNKLIKPFQKSKPMGKSRAETATGSCATDHDWNRDPSASKPRDEWRTVQPTESLRKSRWSDSIGLTNAWVMPIKTRIGYVSDRYQNPQLVSNRRPRSERDWGYYWLNLNLFLTTLVVQLLVRWALRVVAGHDRHQTSFCCAIWLATKGSATGYLDCGWWHERVGETSSRG